MAASATDKLRKIARRWVGQIGSGGVADDTTTTIPLSSTTNLPTDTAVTLVIDRVDSNGTSTSTLEETIVGVVSGTNIINAVRGVEGTAQAHSAGAVVELLWAADNWNDAVDWGLVEHNQDGTHDGATVTTLKATGAEINTGTEDAKIVTPKAIADSSIPTATSTTTFTNKRITKRVGTSASAATHTINSDNYDVFTVTAQGEAVTFAEPSGTPTQGQTLVIRIKDDGTARAITWNAIFRAGDIPLPTTTVLSKTLYCGFMYNSTDTKWDLLAVLDNV